MKKLPVFTAAVVASIGLMAGTASAAPPAGAGDGGKPVGIACQQDGISTLRSAGLLSAVAKDGIEVVDPALGNTSFPEVLHLHRTDPALFRTGGVTVAVPGGTLAATWCNPA